MEFYNNEEVCFQQIKRTAKMMIGQEDIDNIKRIDIPDFDDEESEIIKELHKKLLKLPMPWGNAAGNALPCASRLDFFPVFS